MSKKNVNLNKEIIALFSGQSSTITTPKLYYQLTGSFSLAVILNQIVFWSNKSSCNDGYFYKKYEEWFEELHIPERTLRRRFDTLESNGWIHTKVKMVVGKNVKHIKPDMDKIIESISNMLDIDCPNRQEPDIGAENEQDSCTKVAPTGQTGRSEPAKLADPTIYTDNHIQTTTTESSSSEYFFSKSIDEELLCAREKTNDDRSDEEFLSQCKYHIEQSQKGGYNFQQSLAGLMKIVKRGFEVPEGYKQKSKFDGESEQERRNRQHIQNEFRKEREIEGYVSADIEKYGREKFIQKGWNII